jgi:hypothetical protein
MTLSTQEINANFKIKINGWNFDTEYKTTLVGVSGLIELLGEELADKLILKAWGKGEDIVVCKLRRGLTVRFYSI